VTVYFVSVAAGFAGFMCEFIVNPHNKSVFNIAFKVFTFAPFVSLDIAINYICSIGMICYMTGFNIRRSMAIIRIANFARVDT